MARLLPHIRYVNPYGGHPILRRDGRDAYDAVQEFGVNCADASTDWHGGMIDLAYTGEQYSPEGWRVEPVIEVLKQRLAIPESTFAARTLVDHTLQYMSWPVPSDLHAWAVEFSLSCMKAKRGYPDAVAYTCTRHFRLRMPPRGPVLPGQDDTLDSNTLIHSSLLLHVSSGNTSAFFDLVLPFAEPGPEFVAYVAAIRPYLPIRLARGNFKHWTLNKAGTDYRIRKIDRSVLDGVA